MELVRPPLPIRQCSQISNFSYVMASLITCSSKESSLLEHVMMLDIFIILTKLSGTKGSLKKLSIKSTRGVGVAPKSNVPVF